MDYDKLKGKLVENKKTYAECADFLSISTTAFSNKMNGKSLFDVIEVNKLIDYLKLDRNQAMDIFLSENLHNIQVEK